MFWVQQKRMAVVGLLFLCATLLTSSVAASPATPAAGERNWLFTVSFESGTLTPSAEGDGSATLTLTGVDPIILAFTDRPERMVALVQAQTFVDILQSTMDDPPNAALAGRQSVSEQQNPVVIELRSATFDGSAETLTFNVGVVQNPSEATPTGSALPPETLQGGYLFIDDVQIPVEVPVNVCGNSVGVIGLLNPAFGNTCVNA